MTEVTATNTDTTAPATSQEASEQLEALSRDKDWGAKLLAGDVDTRRQYDALVDKSASAEDRIDAVLAGKISTMFETIDEDHPMSTRDLASAVSRMREDGLTDKTIKMAITGGAISAEEHRQATITLSNLKGNKEWTKKLMAGDVATRRDFEFLTLLAISPVRGQ